MCFLTGKRCHKTINHRSFYCFAEYSVYYFSNLSSTAVLMISSFALRGPLFIFLATENDRTDSTDLSLIDEDQSFTLIGTNYLVMNNFQSPWKNHIQLITLNSFLFIVSRPVFCCLHAVVWTQIATWKWNQSLFPRGLYSSRDSKHQRPSFCL